MRLVLVLTLMACSGGRTQAGDDSPPAAAPSPTEANASAKERSAWPAWACAMGPIVGSTEIEPTVEAGAYRARYQYRRHKFITMERDVRENVKAAAELTLAEDGTFVGCVGVDEERVASVGRHASPDRQYHSNRSASRRLLGLRGRWEQSSDGARLTVERIVWKRCDAPEAEMSPLQGVQLACGTLASNDRLPGGALACRSLGTLPLAEDIGLDLGENRRAGPWTMRHDVTRRAADPRPVCGPWLLLGAAPGLTVESVEQRADAPTVTFAGGAAALEERAFLETIDAGVR